MHIFIDESGTFAPTEGKHSVSLVAALVFSDRGLTRFEREYAALRKHLPKDNGEVKGKLLSELQVRKVTRLIRRSGCLLEIIVMDSAFHTAQEVERHKKVQAEKLTENLTDEHHKNTHVAVWGLRSRLEALAPQLYLQSLAMTELIYTVLYNASIYFAFRSPPELGEYHWTMDAKGRGRITDWEDWWSKIIMPVTQARTLREPFVRVRGGDFSYQDKFLTEPYEYLIPSIDSSSAEEFLDLRPILTNDLRFSSDAEHCLEAVDVIANATRRAFHGNLKDFGWNEIPTLMIHRRDHYLRLMTVAATDKGRPPLPYVNVIDAFRSGGRLMFPSE